MSASRGLQALREFEQLSLELPYRGRTFRIPPATIATGRRLVLLAEETPGDDLAALVLGSALDDMQAAGTPAGFIGRALSAAMVDWAQGRAAAEAEWNGEAEQLEQAPAKDGLEALDAYGIGEKDPITGLYEAYDELPSELAAQPDGEPVSWVRIFELFDVVEYCFHAHLGVDLTEVWDVKPWRWFAVRVRGLLADETVLAAQFRDEKPPPAADDAG